MAQSINSCTNTLITIMISAPITKYIIDLRCPSFMISITIIDIYMNGLIRNCSTDELDLMSKHYSNHELKDNYILSEMLIILVWKLFLLSVVNGKFANESNQFYVHALLVQ